MDSGCAARPRSDEDVLVIDLHEGAGDAVLGFQGDRISERGPATPSVGPRPVGHENLLVVKDVRRLH
jgi:hypothetical protein